MYIDYIMGMEEYAARADKAAVGTINRPLQVVGVVCYKS
jgi:hypothetical protein